MKIENRILFNNNLNNLFQGKNHRNRAVLEVLRKLEFGEPDIRQVLIILSCLGLPSYLFVLTLKRII